MREELAEKIGLTLDDDGGLKQKKLIVLSDDYFIPSFNLRPADALCLTGSFSRATHANYIHRLEEHNDYQVK